MRPPLSEDDIDAITGQVFASPCGKTWLALHSHSHPEMVASIQERIARMRARWGDRSEQEP